MMPQSGNLDPNEMNNSANTGSSLMGFLKSPGTLLQGYNQVPGGMSADGLSNSASQMFSRDNLRSFSALLGTGEDNAFGCLLSPPLLVERLRHNFTYFYLNYMVLTAAFFCVCVFLKPTAWIGIGILAVAWVGMANSIQDERMLKGASIGMSFVSALVLYYLLSNTFWWTIYLSGALIAAHAMLRDTATLQMMNDPVMIPDAGFYQQPQLVGV